MTAWLHYALGNSIGQIIDIFNVHLPVKLTTGGLTQIWNRIGLTLKPWHDEIRLSMSCQLSVASFQRAAVSF